ncbi:MAG: M56 family metallopeptidase [Bacteroidetes bacterium]|nr:M56 family metallopeptidase [Bacteroidota bacterium]
MNNLFPYLMESSLCLAVCYGFYYLVLQKETTLLFNRFYLLGTTLFSLMTPLLKIPLNLPEVAVMATGSKTTSTTVSVMEDPTMIQFLPVQEAALSTADWLLITWLSISVFFLLRFVFNVSRIIYAGQSGEKVNYSNAKLILSNRGLSPHSFFRYIFLNKTDYESGAINNEVLLHEKAHCDELHTIDILFIEFIKVFFWWNPFVWMYKQSMQLNHEYLADNKVLQNTNIIDYQKAILGVLEKNRSLALVSHFNYYSIKKRFTMMTKTKTKNNSQLWRIWLSLPILLGLFALTVNTNAQEKGDDKEKVKKEIKIELKGEELSKEEIDKIIEKEVSKLHLDDDQDVNVNVDSENGVTTITINGGKAIAIALDDEDIEKEMKVIKIQKEGEDELKWIVKNNKDLEMELDKMEMKLQYELEDLDEKIKVIQIRTEDEMQRKMEEIELRLEEIGEKKEEIMKILEEELMDKYQLDEKMEIIKIIEVEEKDTKEKKKRK